MKRSDMLLKLQRYYSTTHVMVEGNYITSDQFMESLLNLIEKEGMLPPFSSKSETEWYQTDAAGYEWEKE